MSRSSKAEHIFQRRHLSHTATQIMGLSQGRGTEGVKRKEKKKQALNTKKSADRIHIQGCVWDLTCSFSCFRVLFHGCKGKELTLAMHISVSHTCSLRKHLALVNKTAGKNILFYFPIVISL